MVIMSSIYLAVPLKEVSSVLSTIEHFYTFSCQGHSDVLMVDLRECMDEFIGDVLTETIMSPPHLGGQIWQTLTLYYQQSLPPNTSAVDPPQMFFEALEHLTAMLTPYLGRALTEMAWRNENIDHVSFLPDRHQNRVDIMIYTAPDDLMQVGT